MADNSEKYMRITNKTLRYGSTTYQIANLTHVEKEVLKPYYEIGKDAIKDAIWKCVFSALGFAAIAWFLSNYFFHPFALALLLVPVGVGGSYGSRLYAAWEERETKLTKYALCMNTNSGGSQVFVSEEEGFIDKLVEKVSDIMDNEEKAVSYTVNIEDKRIDNSETVFGDKFSNVGGDVNNVKNATVSKSMNKKVGK